MYFIVNFILFHTKTTLNNRVNKLFKIFSLISKCLFRIIDSERGTGIITKQRKHYKNTHIHRKNIHKKSATYATYSRKCHERHERLSMYSTKSCSNVVLKSLYMYNILQDYFDTSIALFRGKGNVHHWPGSSFFKRTSTLSLRLRCNSATSLVLRAYLSPVLVMFNSYYYTRIPTISAINSLRKTYMNSVFRVFFIYSFLVLKPKYN